MSQRVAVIGAGAWGQNLVRTFAELGELAAVAEASSATREKMSALYPDVPMHAGYADILQSDVPAVAIATPVPTHYGIARAALLAGKDVFVEKPITLSVLEALALQKLAVEHDRMLMVGHLLLYQPAIQWIKAYLDSGELGQVYSLHQSRLKLGRVRTAENVLWSLGVHDIAVLLHLVGDLPQRVKVQGQRALQEGIEDDVYLHLSFAGGVQAHLHVSWLWPKQERGLTVVGEKGMLCYDELTQTVTLHRKGVDEGLAVWDAGSDVAFRGEAEPLRLEAQHFLACVAERKTPLSDGENGIAVLQVLEEAMRGMKEGAM